MLHYFRHKVRIKLYLIYFDCQLIKCNHTSVNNVRVYVRCVSDMTDGKIQYNLGHILRIIIIIIIINFPAFINQYRPRCISIHNIYIFFNENTVYIMSFVSRLMKRTIPASVSNENITLLSLDKRIFLPKCMSSGDVSAQLLLCVRCECKIQSVHSGLSREYNVES